MKGMLSPARPALLVVTSMYLASLLWIGLAATGDEQWTAATAAVVWLIAGALAVLVGYLTGHGVALVVPSSVIFVLLIAGAAGAGYDEDLWLVNLGVLFLVNLALVAAGVATAGLARHARGR